MLQETHNGVRQQTRFGSPVWIEQYTNGQATYKLFRRNRNWIWTIGKAMRKFLGNKKQDFRTPSYNKMAMGWGDTWSDGSNSMHVLQSE
jgi:hypothetical protein